MDIAIAKITNVSKRYAKGAVHVTLKSYYGTCEWRFINSDSADVQRLSQIMSYAGAGSIEELEGKSIREVVEGNRLRALGHITEDRFIPIFTDGFLEVSKEELEKML